MLRGERSCERLLMVASVCYKPHNTLVLSVSVSRRFRYCQRCIEMRLQTGGNRYVKRPATCFTCSPMQGNSRSSFWVIFHNHTLMNPEAIAWLNQFADQPLNDHQRLALSYLRYNEKITNSDYQRLNRVDSVTANRELRGLAQLGLMEQHGTRRWAHYTFHAHPEVKVTQRLLAEEEKILEYVRRYGSINNAECRDVLRVGLQRASYLLKKMHRHGLLKLEGERRWTRYHLP